MAAKEESGHIMREAIPSSNSIFNSAVVPFKNGFAGVFRCDDKSRRIIKGNTHKRRINHYINLMLMSDKT